VLLTVEGGASFPMINTSYTVLSATRMSRSTNITVKRGYFLCKNIYTVLSASGMSSSTNIAGKRGDISYIKIYIQKCHWNE